MSAPTDPLLTSFSNLARQVWYWPVIRGVIAILFGVVALAWPGKTAAVIVIAVGIFAVVDGLVEIANGIRYRGTGGAGLHVTIGLLGLIVGIVLLVWPGKTAEVLVWFIGLWTILGGLVQCAASVSLRGIAGSGWGWGLFAGLLGIVFGVLVLFNVSGGLVAIVWLIALWAIVWGVMLIAFGFQLRSLGRRAGQVSGAM